MENNQTRNITTGYNLSEFNEIGLWNNKTNMTRLPRELTFTDDSLVSVITYSLLFTVSAIGNLTVFITLFKQRHKKSRVNLFIMHLCIADMIVTFVMMPMEIGWHVTVSWTAGDTGCRLLMFFRSFGFYLSSFVLIVISLDRYIAIAYPLWRINANRRGKIMLSLCWLFSAIASSPQSVIFHEERHPVFMWFAQCVTFNFFPNTTHELMYNLFSFIMLYILPLAAIVITYTLIVYEITKKTREIRQHMKGKRVHYSSNFEYGELRRSSVKFMQRAKSKSLKMSIVIVAVFIVCWTPYFVISAWWWIDKQSAGRISPKINRGLFIFAVSNSCVNPIVYGMFNRASQRELSRKYNWLLSKLPGCCYSRRHLNNITSIRLSNGTCNTTGLINTGSCRSNKNAS